MGRPHALHVHQGHKDTTNCYDKCEQAWPPLLQTDAPKLGDGLDAKLLGTTTRKDGTIQVTTTVCRCITSSKTRPRAIPPGKVLAAYGTSSRQMASS